MAITHEMFEIDDSQAVAITPLQHAGRDITIQNLDGSGYLYIGGSNVTTTSFGYRIPPGSAWSIELRKDESVYAIGSTSVLVSVLYAGLESLNG
jgi:hypothetical protein